MDMWKGMYFSFEGCNFFLYLLNRPYQLPPIHLSSPRLFFVCLVHQGPKQNIKATLGITVAVILSLWFPQSLHYVHHSVYVLCGGLTFHLSMDVYPSWHHPCFSSQAPASAQESSAGRGMGGYSPFVHFTLTHTLSSPHTFL